MAQYDLAAAKLKRRRELGSSPRAVLKCPLLTGDELLAGWNDNRYPVLGQALAEKLLDMADMIGFAQAHRLLRIAINAMRVHPPIVLDDSICERTVQAIRFVIARQSEVALLGALRTAQVMHLSAVAETHDVRPERLHEWLARAHDC